MVKLFFVRVEFMMFTGLVNIISFVIIILGIIALIFTEKTMIVHLEKLKQAVYVLGSYLIIWTSYSFQKRMKAVLVFSSLPCQGSWHLSTSRGDDYHGVKSWKIMSSDSDFA